MFNSVRTRERWYPGLPAALIGAIIAGVIAGLVQDDAGVMQRRRVLRIGLEDRVVAQECFAQLSLLMQAKCALEFGRNGHAADSKRRRQV